VPLPAPCIAATVSLFDHLVHAGEKRRRDFDTERFRRLEINEKQEFGGLLNRKLGRFGTFQNSIDVVSPTSSHGEKVRPVRNQSSPLHKALSKESDGKPTCAAKSGTRFDGKPKIGSAIMNKASAPRALAAAIALGISPRFAHLDNVDLKAELSGLPRKLQPMAVV
jgi:hypothetical protein